LQKKAESLKHKADGNAALQKGDFSAAVAAYTKAIDCDGANHVFYSNRSAAHLSAKNLQNALDDAEATIGLNPDFAKGYGRKGAALHAMKRYNDSANAYEEGLAKFPSDAGLKSGLEGCIKDRDTPEWQKGGRGGGMGGMGGMGNSNPMAGLFGPEMIKKMEQNPKLKEYLNDKEFMAKIDMLKRDPNSLQMMMGDPRIMEVFQMMLGGNVSFGGNDEPPPAPAPAPKRKEPEPEPEPEVDTSNFTEQELKEHNDKKAAVALKTEGNELYKKKDFDGALGKYDEAIAKDPKNMTFISNKAAVYFTQKKWDEVISACEEAMEVGKANFAPFEDRAKCLTRWGKTLFKQGKVGDAIEKLKESQLEAYQKDTERLLKTWELEKRKADVLAYQDPDKAQEAKDRGNAHFREKRFGEAVKEYEEAVKRDPNNPPIRNNLAAALCKVMDFNGAKMHIDKALDMDPKYVKAYARKGDIHVLMKENHKALDAYRAGLALEPDNTACKEGATKVTNMINMGSQNMSEDEKRERAAHGMADPEVQNILQDPVIRQVLQDFNEKPQAAQQAMRDPGVASKIEKLIAAGVLQVGR